MLGRPAPPCSEDKQSCGDLLDLACMLGTYVQDV